MQLSLHGPRKRPARTSIRAIAGAGPFESVEQVRTRDLETAHFGLRRDVGDAGPAVEHLDLAEQLAGAEFARACPALDLDRSLDDDRDESPGAPMRMIDSPAA